MGTLTGTSMRSKALPPAMVSALPDSTWTAKSLGGGFAAERAVARLRARAQTQTPRPRTEGRCKGKLDRKDIIFIFRLLWFGWCCAAPDSETGKGGRCLLFAHFPCVVDSDERAHRWHPGMPIPLSRRLGREPPVAADSLKLEHPAGFDFQTSVIAPDVPFSGQAAGLADDPASGQVDAKSIRGPYRTTGTSLSVLHPSGSGAACRATPDRFNSSARQGSSGPRETTACGFVPA